jgi:parvulin-like peptidyl-prolyl isomerase
MFRVCVALVLAITLRAEVVDRLAIAVGHQVITQLQLDEELRVTALLNHQPVSRSLDSRRAAADRLVEQLLIQREMELSRYPLPDDQAVEKYIAEVRQQNGGAAALNKALSEYSITDRTLRRHLELQLTVLRFIEFRFRGDVAISDSEIEAAYRREAANWEQTHREAPPSLEASRERLRTELAEERTDAALNTWLTDSRKQLNIVFLDKSLE